MKGRDLIYEYCKNIKLGNDPIHFKNCKYLCYLIQTEQSNNLISEEIIGCPTMYIKGCKGLCGIEGIEKLRNPETQKDFCKECWLVNLSKDFEGEII
jgi:hypothetical protein